MAAQLAGTGLLELAAVVLAILYLVLAVRESLWCWGAAFVSTAIFLYLFYAARLYMESALQVFYLAMAVYGWTQWRYGGSGGALRLPITRWPWRVHLPAMAAILALSLASGWLLARHTQAVFPYLDSFTSWAAVWSTYLVARKKLENWLYWIVIDSASIYLYLQRDLALTALLFALYVAICVVGYRGWQRRMASAAGAAA